MGEGSITESRDSRNELGLQEEEECHFVHGVLNLDMLSLKRIATHQCLEGDG